MRLRVAKVIVVNDPRLKLKFHFLSRCLTHVRSQSSGHVLSSRCTAWQTSDTLSFLFAVCRTQHFPDIWGGGRQPQSFGQNLLFGKIFAENCMKMKDIGLRGGAVHP